MSRPKGVQERGLPSAGHSSKPATPVRGNEASPCSSQNIALASYPESMEPSHGMPRPDVLNGAMPQNRYQGNLNVLQLCKDGEFLGLPF